MCSQSRLSVLDLRCSQASNTSEEYGTCVCGPAQEFLRSSPFRDPHHTRPYVLKFRCARPGIRPLSEPSIETQNPQGTTATRPLKPALTASCCTPSRKFCHTASKHRLLARFATRAIAIKHTVHCYHAYTLTNNEACFVTNPDSIRLIPSRIR